MARDVLLVGSVPLATAEDVFATCGGALDGLVRALPDGEVGERTIWIVCQALRVFDGHEALETVQRPRGTVDPSRPWIPGGLDDLWSFRIRPGATPHFDDLRYASWAAESYDTFCSLRERGVLPEGVRFQVSLPTPAAPPTFFVHDPEHLQAILGPYEAAMLREVEQICTTIPAADLAIQWDVCSEVLENAGAALPWLLPEPWERYVASLSKLGSAVPDEALLGFHFCYADLGHVHMLEPVDLSVCVRMANAAAEHAGRRVDWVHMPVPADRDDVAYFSPLAELTPQAGQLYLGLVHDHDGIEGAGRRLAAAATVRDDFGVATECGFGRRDPSSIGRLLGLHREIASLER